LQLAQRPAEILQLKAPNTSGDIGLALLQSGTALNALKKHAEAARVLDQGEDQFRKAIPAPPEHLRRELQMQKAIARATPSAAQYFRK
jgi:hypothetical protein